MRALTQITCSRWKQYYSVR